MRILGALSLAGAVLLALPMSAPAEKRDVRIGLVAEGPYYLEEACWERFREELAVLGGENVSFSFPADRQLIGNWEPDSIRESCRRLLEAEDVDFVVGMGLVPSAYFYSQTDLPKPVVLFGSIDGDLLGFEDEEGRSPVPNLTFQLRRGKLDSELAWIKKLAGDRPVTVLLDPELLEALPDLEERAHAAELRNGLKLTPAFYGDTVAATSGNLPPDTGLVYLTPSARFNTPDKISALLEELNRRRLPTFAFEGTRIVELGALAALFPESVEKAARNAALKVYEIARGEPPADLSVLYHEKEEFTINLETARRIGYYPGFELLMQATQTGSPDPEGPLLTVPGAVGVALRENLRYQIARRELEETRAEYRKVLSSLFPHIEAAAAYQRVDTDRAKASGGFINRWETRATVGADQLIFDYPTWKAVALAALAVESAEIGEEAARLDTAADAILAYLGVLQAQELERIQRENLAGTRNHLDTAKVRLEQGVGNREDILRWEAQYKNVLSATVAARFSLQKARLALNQVLNRPQESPFRLDPLRGAEPWEGTLFGDRRLDSLFQNWREADLLREFLVEEGNRRSPEVRAARLTLSMAEADLERAGTRIWTPTLSARFEYSRLFDEETWDPITQSWGNAGEYPDDDEWFFGASVSIPVWMGGSNWAELGRARAARRATDAGGRRAAQWRPSGAAAASAAGRRTGRGNLVDLALACPARRPDRLHHRGFRVSAALRRPMARLGRNGPFGPVCGVSVDG